MAASIPGGCENPTTRQLPVLTQVRTAVLASARKHKTQNTRKPRQTWKRLFHNQQGRYECCCNLLLRRKLCTLAGSLEKQHAFMHEFTQIFQQKKHLENFQWKSNFKNMIRSSSKLFNSSSHAKFHRNPSKRFKLNENAETSKQCQKYIIRASQ